MLYPNEINFKGRDFKHDVSPLRNKLCLSEALKSYCRKMAFFTQTDSLFVLSQEANYKNFHLGVGLVNGLE